MLVLSTEQRGTPNEVTLTVAGHDALAPALISKTKMICMPLFCCCNCTGRPECNCKLYWAGIMRWNCRCQGSSLGPLESSPGPAGPNSSVVPQIQVILLAESLPVALAPARPGGLAGGLGTLAGGPAAGRGCQ